MAWGKGFFRVWVILSALWIGLAVLMSKPATYAGFWNAPKYEIQFKSGQRITLDTSLTRKVLVESLDNEIKQEATRSGAEVGASTRDEILKSVNLEYSTLGDQAQEAWLITLIPPVGLLILGLAVAWIARGFRSA